MKRQMTSTESGHSFWGSLSLLAALIMLFALGCEAQSSEPTGGETHFLRLCNSDADACGPYSCLCGVCTTECSIDTPCASLPGAQCVTLNAACEIVTQVCDVQCRADRDCMNLSSGHHCIDGQCRLASSHAPSVGDGGASGAPDATACESSKLIANEVVILGDSFFATTHEVTGYLEAMARQDGVLSDGDRFRDYSNLTSNALAWLGPGIASQYEGARAESEVGVVIMNGGGADVLLGTCDVVDPACPTLTDAVQALQELLLQMNADSVEQVIFVGYPNPQPPDLAEEMNLLRPLLEEACNESPVPCAWLDLRPSFSGQEAELIAEDGLNPTSAGSQASAKVVWDFMQENCVGR